MMPLRDVLLRRGIPIYKNIPCVVMTFKIAFHCIFEKRCRTGFDATDIWIEKVLLVVIDLNINNLVRRGINAIHSWRAALNFTENLFLSFSSGANFGIVLLNAKLQ